MSKNKSFALGRLKTGVMNKTEAAYAAHLEHQKRAGSIKWYRFEGLKFRLADNTFYTPDFAVMRHDDSMEIHEVKGFLTEDGNVKWKVAAEMYPFRFLMIRQIRKRDGGGWITTEAGNAKS